MENNKDITPPKRTLKRPPKIPLKKLPEKEVTKTEVFETKDDIIDKHLLSKIHSLTSHDAFRKGIFKIDKKAKLSDGSYVPATEVEKEYVEPWDYNNLDYPVTLPLRRPYSGDPENLDEEEFGEVATLSATDEITINAAADLGLMEEILEPQMLFFQLPASLPLLSKRPVEAAASKVKETKKGSRLEDLPGGFMGKLLVYKSGAVKMKLGDVLFDVSPGVDFTFAQDVAVINTRKKHCCILGQLKKRAVVTPDVDSLLASLDV